LGGARPLIRALPLDAPQESRPRHAGAGRAVKPEIRGVASGGGWRPSRDHPGEGRRGPDARPFRAAPGR
jgi:hypothetical protein